MDQYKEIKIGGSPQEPIEITLDDIDLPDEQLNEQDPSEVPNDAPELNKTHVEQEEKRVSRAQKRIKQLNDEKKEALARAEATSRENEELRRQLQTGTKATKESLKENLEDSIQGTTRELAQAIQNGESELVVALQQKLWQYNTQFDRLSTELSQYKEVEAPKAQQPTQQANEVPEKALDWIDEHPEFKTDEMFYHMALMTNNKLIQEGYRPDTDEFYEELNDRLTPRFPEVFGTKGKPVASDDGDSVKYKQTTTPSDEETLKTSRQPKKPVEQTVSGSSRPSSANASVKSKSSGNTVVLTPEHIQQADKWNMSLEQMARRVAHAEKNKDSNGYVPIFIDKKGK